jgi:hypothetical protein
LVTAVWHPGKNPVKAGVTIAVRLERFVIETSR